MHMLSAVTNDNHYFIKLGHNRDNLSLFPYIINFRTLKIFQFDFVFYFVFIFVCVWVSCAQVSLELPILPPPTKCWDYRYIPHHSTSFECPYFLIQQNPAFRRCSHFLALVSLVWGCRPAPPHLANIFSNLIKT